MTAINRVSKHASGRATQAVLVLFTLCRPTYGGEWATGDRIYRECTMDTSVCADPARSIDDQ